MTEDEAKTRIEELEKRVAELEGVNAAIGDLKQQVQDILRRLKREAIA